jgi:hypothetical protein
MEIKEALNEFKKKQNKLELDIFTYVENALKQFEQETGLSVCSIDIDFEDVTGFKDEEKRFVPCRCDVDYSFFNK